MMEQIQDKVGKVAEMLPNCGKFGFLPLTEAAYIFQKSDGEKLQKNDDKHRW